jgi:exodeoxyribonuclease VII small subunit
MATAKKYKNFEKAMERLEEITADLESGEPSLEKAIKLYTEGLEIARLCSDQLDDAEKKIRVITEKNNDIIETDFDETDEEE